MTDPSLDPIFDYLREHSGRYSYSALRDQLVESGYDPALVDRALAIYQHENLSTLPEPESRSRGCALFCGLLLLLSVGLGIVLFGLCGYYYSKGMSGQ
jgi:hypothetical protein